MSRLLLPLLTLLLAPRRGALDAGTDIGLKFVQLDVPGAIHSGESTWLKCLYELGRDELYSVKWYKNNVEFFRFLPSDEPAGQIYDLLGVYVNLTISNATHVYLFRTDLNTEGTYGCEVSTEAPSFRTVKADKELRIYVLPTHGPIIDGIIPPFLIDEILNISCTSGASKPTAHMKWYINDAEVAPTWRGGGDEPRQPRGGAAGLRSRRIGLVFRPSLYRNHKSIVRVVCLSSIPQIYASTSEEIVIRDRTNPYHVSHSAPGQKGPVIHGHLPWYHVGDVVDINCSSSRSPIPAHIRWFINDIEAKIEHLIRYPTLRYPDGSEVSKLGLRMRVEHHHFKNDELRIKCTTTLYKMLTMRADRTLFSSAQQHHFFYDLTMDFGFGFPLHYLRTAVFLLVSLLTEFLWTTFAVKQ